MCILCNCGPHTKLTVGNTTFLLHVKRMGYTCIAIQVSIALILVSMLAGHQLTVGLPPIDWNNYVDRFNLLCTNKMLTYPSTNFRQ